MSNTTVGGVPGHMAEIVVVRDNILKFLNARLALWSYWLYPAKLKGYNSNRIHAQPEKLCLRTLHLSWITIESFQTVFKPENGMIVGEP